MTSHLLGPLYCETPAVAAGFPLEFINTFTSFVPALFGCYACWWLYRNGVRSMVLYMLAGLLFATGIGSALWHGLRTPLALSLDVYPGLLFFVVFAFVWPFFLGNRWWGYATVAALFGLVFLFDTVLQLPGLHGYITRFVGPIILVACILIAVTHRLAQPAFWWSVATIVLALVAATARTLDGYACAFSSIGSHFLWHIFLGASALCGIILLVRVAAHRNRVLASF